MGEMNQSGKPLTKIKYYFTTVTLIKNSCKRMKPFLSIQHAESLR